MIKNMVIGLVIIIVVAGGWFLWKPKTMTKTAPKIETAQNTFSPELEAVLAKKITLLETLVKDPVIIDAVIAAYAKNKLLSQKEIATLDQAWKDGKGVDAFIKPFLTNATAGVLLAFQEQHLGFTEMFVTCALGLNVGQTNKTSDYYQADEAWWIDAFAAGAGKSYFGEIEYDESAKTEAISLYVPIRATDNRAIGVLKAVMDINAIKGEL